MNRIPMIYRSAAILVLLFPVFRVSAQVDQALKLLGQKEYSRAEPLFRAALSDPKDRVLAHYGLALLFNDQGFSNYRLDSAFQQIEASEAAYKAMDYKDKGKVSKDLSSSEIRKLRTLILKDALQEAETENTLKGYQYFIEHYPGTGSRYEGKAMKARNLLAFEAASAQDTELAYNQLLEEYGNDLKAQDRALFDEAERRQFDRYIQRTGWTGYEEFAAQHPDHLVVRDSLFTSFKELWYGPVSDFAAFIDAYPSAPITRYAIDSLGSRLEEEADTTLSLRFLQEYPDHPSHDGVYLGWYQSLAKRFTHVSQLERFKAAHPDFPFPERLAADEDILLERSFEKLEVGKALGAFRAFIEEHPGYSKIDSVWWRYYLTFKQERPGPENLDRFLQVHPDFPFPEAVTADRKVMEGDALEASWKALQSGEGTSELFRFVKSEKDNPYREAAVDLLADRLLSEGQLQSIEGFLKDFPGHDRQDELLLKLWEVFPAKDDAKAIQAFIGNYPDFPRSELLDEALEKVPLSEEEILTFTESRRKGFVNYIKHYAPEQKAFDALWRMLGNDFTGQDWDAVYTSLKSFQPQFGENNEEFTSWLRAFAPGKRIKVRGISPLINTEREEYSAVISADDQSLYFCRNVGVRGDRVNEDMYVSHRDEQGRWREAQAISDLSGEENEAPEALSADGNRMLVFINGNICATEKTRDGWSAPQPLPAAINRSVWQADARITADGKAIIFASEVGPIKGNKDIYVSLAGEDGHWEKAFPIGEMINTGKEDRSPFLHPDMKTLYFSSAGHRGLGALDIFVSKRLDDSWTNWSVPVNLGPGVNTADNDWSFKVTTSGKQGYFNVLAQQGGGDIFIMDLPPEFQPDPVATVSGKLTGIDSDPVEAEIIWTNLETLEVIQTTTSDPADGRFFATLPNLGIYSYTIRKKGYFPLSGNLNFSEKLYHHHLEKAMTVISVEEMKTEGLAMPLNNLFFETAKFDIQPASIPELNGLADWVRENDLAIEIHGHTDQVGDDADNLMLSENRAKAVRDYLIGQGLPGQRIKAEGFGESKPVAGNDSEAGRALNRRVEIKIAFE